MSKTTESTSKKKTKKKDKLPKCCRRKERGGATYKYWGKNYIFDVQRAMELVQDGREPTEVEDESVRLSVKNSWIDDVHVTHVDPTKPGIIAHVFAKADDGDDIHAHVLIDGNHRAARCLQLEKPYFAYVLTEQESKDILIRKPVKSFTKVNEDE
ncbi:hypothetical protein [Adhaeretor mobilis]|uniref:Uncharacterized protein n=1 Tax=Adhaeretor mobilis TaxID=1930276 RepID=A0A517MVH9_9BACT|nr:hypothetical protein [Adhaeretor mobilis]QDS98883.1 hypothetical protein HG15A2_21700 [Adhaeretor mobilis]